MRWKLIVLVFLVVVAATFFIVSGNTTENFGQDGSAAPDGKEGAAAERYKAGAIAFDAYNAVHGKPPLTEALDHYRKIAEDGRLDAAQMKARIQSDARDLPATDTPVAITVSDRDVDAELERLKAHAVNAEAMTAPLVGKGGPAADPPQMPPGGAAPPPAVSARLQEISNQLSTIAREVQYAAGPVPLGQPPNVERFFAF
jgi:predicted small secreted protein